MRFAATLTLCLAIVAAGDMQAAPQSRPVTYSEQIAPLLERNCAGCHRPGQAAPFSLLTYADAKRHANQIAAVTKTRYMPPWLPTADSGPFVEERRLTNDQIGLIQSWVRDGAPEGATERKNELSPAPVDAGWQLGKPDLLLTVEQPYVLAAGGAEVFWNFVIPVPLTGARWVKAVEIHPGAPRAVHHASILLDRGRSARKQHPGATGFAGMDLSIAETSFDPDGTFLSWKPGSVPMVEPQGMGWRADPGMDVIFNVHLRPTGREERVAPSIGLYFTDEAPKKFPMLVELERDAAIDIPAGDRDYVVKDDFRLPMDVDVLAIYPHAHYRGRMLEGFATLPNGMVKNLIRIPEWDLDWQGVYHYREPVRLPRGSVVSMRFHYDNSNANPRNPSIPAKRVRGGSHADDEMGNLWLQLLPVGDGDQRPALMEALMRQRIEKDPADFTAQFSVGDLLLSRGNAKGALPYFETAVKLQPGNPMAASELGVALASAGRLAEAKEQFERVLAQDGSFTDARFDLASAQAALHDWAGAANNFRQVLIERSGDPKAAEHLGEVLYAWADELARAGRPGDAIPRYKAALRYRAQDPELYTSLGSSLAQTGHFEEARAALQEAIRLAPAFEPPRRILEKIAGR